LIRLYLIIWCKTLDFQVVEDDIGDTPEVVNKDMENFNSRWFDMVDTKANHENNDEEEEEFILE
ncbi:hypothetical protein RYX36_016629, partial [Vicia faba]